MGINELVLSYTRSMEKSIGQSGAQTVETKRTGILLSDSEAEEYRNFKRQKYIAAVNQNIRRACLDLTEVNSVQEISELCALAKKHLIATVRTTPDRLPTVRAALLESQTKIDVLLGGTGKTLWKVKAYETKLCVRSGAGELTVMPNPAFLETEKFTELKKELKKILKKAKTIPVKVFIAKQGELPKLFRLSRLLKELGVGMSVPYFLGVERIKLDDKTGSFLEVRGVETAAEYQKMIGAGVERIQTSRLVEIYAELIKEAENYSFSVPVAEVKTVESIEGPTPVENGKENVLEKTESVDEEKPLSPPLQPSLKEESLQKAEAYRALLDNTKE